jgi:hypothetical protein
VEGWAFTVLTKDTIMGFSCQAMIVTIDIGQ